MLSIYILACSPTPLLVIMVNFEERGNSFNFQVGFLVIFLKFPIFFTYSRAKVNIHQNRTSKKCSKRYFISCNTNIFMCQYLVSCVYNLFPFSLKHVKYIKNYHLCKIILTISNCSETRVHKQYVEANQIDQSHKQLFCLALVKFVLN